MATEFDDDPIPTSAVTIHAPGPMDVLQVAVQRGASIDTIERLVALKIRMDERQAAADFNAAMAAFADECPSIPKTSTAEVVSASKGSRYTYKYAELDQIARVIRPILGRHGLSYTWDSKTENGSISVVCTVRHIGGHGQSAGFSCPTKPLTSSMSAQQEIAAALTYAKRQSLIQALGLTTCDPDSPSAPSEAISAEEAEKIEKALADTGSDRAKFLAYMGVADVAEITTRDLKKAWEPLNVKLRAKS